jgi:hypothetical protein
MWVRTLVERPERRQFSVRLPESDAKACERGGAEGGGLRIHRANTGTRQQVGLELQQEIVAGGAAIDPQLRERLPGVLLHRFDEVRRLEAMLSSAARAGARDSCRV